MAPAPVPAGLAAAAAPLPPPAVAVAPVLVAADTADVEEVEPQAPERHQLPIQDVRFTNDILQTDEVPNFIPCDSRGSSVDTYETSIYLSDFPTAKNSESRQAQSTAILPISYDFRPRLPPRDYLEKAIQNRMPPEIRSAPVNEPAASSNQPTQSQKRDVILDSCERTRTLQSTSETYTNPHVHFYPF